MHLPDYISSHNMWLVAENGAKMSVSVGSSAYCEPRDMSGPYTKVEVGFPSGIIPLSWKDYADCSWDSETGEELPWDTSDIYAYLPTHLLSDWFAANRKEK